jgi:hypothetical protein
MAKFRRFDPRNKKKNRNKKLSKEKEFKPLKHIKKSVQTKEYVLE